MEPGLSIGLPEQNATLPSIGKRIEGVVMATDGSQIDLVQDIDKDMLVLIFAQDTCTACAAEADEIANKIEELGALPSNVEIITFLVGLTGDFALEDALAWKQDHGAQWSVVVQNGERNLFKEHFPGSATVPAIVIQKNDRIFFQHTGPIGIEELERLVGGLE